ncbi:MAG: hypothetical protein ACQEQC_07565, partial [Elusimicrobiota bacterium]
MVRISDIYKKDKEPKKTSKKIEPQPQKKEVSNKKNVASEEEIYNEALLLSKEKNDAALASNRVDIDRENLDIIEKLSEQVQESPKKMLEYFYE